MMRSLSISHRPELLELFLDLVAQWALLNLITERLAPLETLGQDLADIDLFVIMELLIAPQCREVRSCAPREL